MTIMPNPYNPHQPTGDPAAFYGHQGVFAFIRQHFVGTALDRPLVLIGRRGVGKSAVLQQLVYQLDDTYRPCIVTLNGIRPLDETALIAALVDAIRESLEIIGASTYRLPEWPGLDDTGDPAESRTVTAAELRAWFRDEYLDVALSALRMRHLVLCFDDAHRLLDALDRQELPETTLDYLGDLLAHYERLDAVLALDAAYEDRMLSVPLLNDPVLHVRLGELPRDEAARLLQQPVSDRYDFEPGVLDGLLDLAGGHPFLLQAIGFLLYRRSEERNHNRPISRNDLDAIRPAVLDQADAIFDPLWQRASQNERSTLIALVQLSKLERDLATSDSETDDGDADSGTSDPPGDSAPGIPDGIPFAALYGWLTGAGFAINKTQLAAALRSLGYVGLVRAQGDRYTLTARLIADWVTANVAPTTEPRATERPVLRRNAAGIGLLAVLVLVAALGLAAISGVFGDDEDDADAPADSSAPTATLAVNLEATRQADFATQTEAARPTATYTLTRTPRPTATPTVTLTPSPTLTPSVTPTPSPSATPSATITPSVTPSRTPTSTPTITPPPTSTPRATATLDPG